MALPKLAEIFTDTNADGLQTSFREFLGYFVKQFYPGVHTQIEKLYFTRLDYPLLVFPVLLLAVATLYAFWARPTVRGGIIAAIPAGMLFYSYFHLWAYWTVVLGLLFAYTLLFAREERERVRGMLALFGTLVLLVIPYAVNYVRWMHSPGREDLAFRFGVSEGREIGLATVGFDYLLYAVLAIAIYALYRRADRKKAVLLWVFLAALVIVWNIQLVVGYVPVPTHWKRIGSPFLFIVMFIIIHDAFQRVLAWRPSLQYAGMTLVVLAAVLVVAKKVNNAVLLHQELQPWVLNKYTFPKDIMDSLQWIDAHLGREPKIISSSPETTYFLTTYTSARPYVALGLLTPMRTYDLEQRYLVASKLFRVPEGALRTALKEDAPVTCTETVQGQCFDVENNYHKNVSYLYSFYFKRGSFREYTLRPTQITQQYRDGLMDRYRALAVDWHSVDAEYVYYGPWEWQFSRPDFTADRHLELIYHNPLVSIFKIVQR